jgi:hypothetical protein
VRSENGGTRRSPGMSATPSISPNSPATSSIAQAQEELKESAGVAVEVHVRWQATSTSGVQIRSIEDECGQP